MAEQIPYAVASSLIDRLASAAFREIGRIYGVMDELKKLKSTVESIKAVLLDAEEKQEREHVVQLWITRLKDVLYPAEDLLDEFFIKDRRHNVDSGTENKVTEVFHSLSPRRLAFRLKMAHKIDHIRKNLNDVVQEMSRLNLSPRTVVVEQTDSVRRETASFVIEKDIIGREDSKKEIIKLLSQPKKGQNISAVAIVGIGGLGKTALAQLVYNDAEVKSIFEKRMWVCVSGNFDIKTILRNMLESSTNIKTDDKLSLDNLQNVFRETLSGKKYLLVLDDTWNESHEKWTQFKTYLMCGAEDSMVLVTTRSKSVAQTMGVDVPYVLNGLTQEESWRVLKKITFGDDIIGVNQTLKSIGKKIAEKCRGVPLAIRTLGGLLRSKSEESEWIDVLRGDFWRLFEDEESILPVLKLSYQNLTPQMRQCFAYCSLYPKDWEIEKDELIELWMAQGYLQCSDEKLMKDVGTKVVKTLLMKSFFQDAEITEHGDILSFKMHDLMHDVATQVAGNDCCCLDGGVKRAVGKPMHVWLGPDAIDFLGSLDASRLRTLILPADFELNEKQLSFILNFKYLRSLRCRGLSKLPQSIGKLKHLRYLCLSMPHSSKMESLPKSISNLVCLQTLRLSDCLQLEFSENVSKLINLRHLHMLDINKLSVIYPSLANIVEISLERCEDVPNIPPLERLPFLKSLNINSIYELEYIYFEDGFPDGTFFPSLERLSFNLCYKLRGWCRMGEDFNHVNHISLPPFPRLSHLSIFDCERLTCMPTFPNLDKSLTLEHCPGEPFEATLNMATTSSRCSVDFTPLSKLKFLCIDRYLLDMIELPMNWMKNLTSLQHLEFQNFSGQALKEMEICFKDDLRCFTSLRKLVIKFSSDLEAIPDWICNLSLLQHIKVVRCYYLESLPEAMPCLTRLQTLEVIACPRLIQECKKEAVRHKIAHIPNIILQESRGAR